MQSARTIRKCSKIIMIVNIIAFVAVGIIIANLNKKSPYMTLFALIVMGVGIFGAVMLNALFTGFADIVDNTYLTAKRGDKEICGKYVQNPSSFPQNRSVSPMPNQNKTVPNTSSIWICGGCGKRNESTGMFCTGCGQKKMIQ